jgi:hypothetical protein
MLLSGLLTYAEGNVALILTLDLGHVKYKYPVICKRMEYHVILTNREIQLACVCLLPYRHFLYY